MDSQGSLESFLKALKDWHKKMGVKLANLNTANEVLRTAYRANRRIMNAIVEESKLTSALIHTFERAISQGEGLADCEDMTP